MGYQNEKTPVGETTGVNGVSDGGDLNHRQHTTVNGGGGKAQSAAERLFENGGENLLDAGLRAAKRGWKIFPCNGKKEPLTEHGFKDATTDEEQITAWAKQYPGALWGRALPNDEVVLDLDMKHGKNGIREFEKLQGCKPEEFEAPRVATATGGNHIYTKSAGRDFKNTVDQIAPGVDTKTDGGYVIIPSGNGSYRWLTDPDTPKPPTPQWAEVALRSNENNQQRAKSDGAGVGSNGAWPEGFGNNELEKACEGICNAGKGRRDKACQDHALWIGHLAGGGAIDIEVARAALLQAARQNKGGGDEYVNPHSPDNVLSFGVTCAIQI